MPGLMDFDERQRTRLPRRSSLSADLGGAEAAEAERAYQELQAVFARPLGLPRRHGRNGAGPLPGCSCEGAACECHEGTSSGNRSGRLPRPVSRDHGHVAHASIAGSYAPGGLLGAPKEPNRRVYPRSPNERQVSEGDLCSLIDFLRIAGANRCIYSCPGGQKSIRVLTIGLLGKDFCPRYIADR